MATIRPSVSPPRRYADPTTVRSSVSEPGESVPALRSGQSIGLDTICLLLQHRRHIHTRAELAEWRRQFRSTVELLRADAADSRTYETR